MSVQAAVAFLNGSSESVNSISDNKNVSPGKLPAWQKQTTNNKERSTTEAAIQELNRIRAGGGGVASMRSRFASDNKPATTATMKGPEIGKAKSPPAESKIKSLSSKETQSRKQTETKQPKPFESSKKPSNPVSRTSFDMIAQELTALYQEALDQYEDAKKELKHLQADMEVYASDATKVRDYEIRVEYLAQKLEQVSEERDSLEQELRMYRERHGNLDTPTSPVFQHRLSAIFDDRQSQYNNDDQEESNNNEKFFDNILDAYGGTDQPEENDMDKDRLIEHLKDQLRAYDHGAKIAVQHYLAELEQERIRSKALKQVVRKQDELIARLEGKSPEASSAAAATTTTATTRTVNLPAPMTERERLLLEQVELQQTELRDTRALLNQLLSERNRTRMQDGGRNMKSNTTSIDVLAELAKPLPSSGLRDGKSTPPLSAPPRDPLPPLPANNPLSKSSARASLASLREESGLSSSVTSWSSSDHHQEQDFNDYEVMYSNYLKTDVPQPESDDEHNPLEHHREALRRLEGPVYAA